MADEIDHAAETLREALIDLTKRVASGRRDPDTDDLVRHCREVSVILGNLVAGLGDGPDENAARSLAFDLDARISELEHQYGLQRLH